MADVNPITNKEMVIAKNSGDSRYSDVTAITHEEMIIEKYLSGGGGGGTSDYTDLENKPKINNVELSGNKSWSDLGVANPMHIAGRVDTVSELPQTASVGDVYLVGLTAAEKDEYVYTTTGWEYIGTSMIPVDSELSPTSENPVQNKVITNALNGKQDTISDLSTIRFNATAGAEAATVVQGIDETGNNYIEMKSGQRVYPATTVPTGNIPTGSVGMGFDEGLWTYKSGTKVSEGVPTANEFTGDISQFDNQGGTGGRYDYFKLTGDYTITLICKDDCTAPNGITFGLNANGGVVTGGFTSLVAQRGIYTQGQVITGKTSDNGYQYIYVYDSGTEFNWIMEHFDIMLNKGSTPLPYEPYGKQKISFYANGQPLTDYTIYGNTGGVGEKTANLFDGNFPGLSGTIQYMPVYVGDISVTLETTASASTSYDAQVFLLEGNVASGASSSANGVWAGNSRRVSAVDGYVTIAYRNLSTLAVPLSNAETWLFERFQLPIICGGSATNIYLDSPLGANDSIDYTTSQTAIPTVDGANNLICDTSVQPSKVSLTYTGWHSDLDDTTARLEALENAPAPSGMTYDTLYEGTTASSYPYPLAHDITNYKFIIIAVGYSNVYTNTVIPVAVWSTITGGGNNYDITVDTAQLRVNVDNIVPRSANSRIVYGVYGIK